MSRRIVFALLTIWAAWLPGFPRASDGVETPRSGPRLDGSADWELYRSAALSDGTRTTFDAFRQKYSLGLSGAIWEPRFNQYSLGLDFFRDDRRVDGGKAASNGIGYRFMTVFFPGRPFPVSLYARSSQVDGSGASLADSNRESAAYGGEWNVSTPWEQNLRLQFDRTAYDLVNPVALKQRRDRGNFEFIQSRHGGETDVRYTYENERELVRASEFTRQTLFASDRAAFGNGTTLLVSGNRTLSEGSYYSGVVDFLTVDRLSTLLDVPRRKRTAFSVGYDYNLNKGSFLDSTSHFLNARARIAIASHWETEAGGTLGSVASVSGATEIRQRIVGGQAALRYNRDWSRFHLGAAYGVTLMRTSVTSAENRLIAGHYLDAEIRVPLAGPDAVFASASYRTDQNDTTGVGFAFDEARASAGIEHGVGQTLAVRGSAFGRKSRYDTFQFGSQKSDEVGLEATLSAPGGGVSLTLSRQNGISTFIPDPAAGSPFVPGNDLVNHADIGSVGIQWRVLRRLSLRFQGRMERRSFSTIGDERVLAYHPEAEWSYGPWRLSAGISHYERNNHTAFKQDALIVRVARLFF